MTPGFDEEDIRRRLRILVIVRSAEKALWAPVSTEFLHLMAYMTNVLAPVWDMPVLDGKLLKQQAGPFYPSLQADADSLVGQGLLLQSDLSYVRTIDGQWRLQGAYTNNRSLSERVLEALDVYPEEREMVTFCEEVAFGLSRLASIHPSRLGEEDATYGDSQVDFGSVVDFGEWSQHNQATNAALHLGRLLPSGQNTTAGEMIHSYVRHLNRRVMNGS